MGAHLHTITVTVSTRDPSTWDEDSVAEAEGSDAEGYRDFAVGRLRHLLRGTAQRHVERHPDQFLFDAHVN